MLIFQMCQYTGYRNIFYKGIEMANLQLNISTELKERLARHCFELKTPQTPVVEEALEMYLQKNNWKEVLEKRKESQDV